MKPLPIVFAFAGAAAIAWRWRRLGWAVRLAGAVVSVALALYGAGIFHLPEFETVIADLGSALGPYTYALVGTMAFLETGAFVGLLVPGETVVIVGGVVAGQGHIDLVSLLGLTWICAFAGDLTGYVLGRRLGRRFLLEHGSRVHITEPRLIRVEAFFARYGLATILIGRFLGLVRALAPFLAGASRYPAGRFAGVAFVGTGLWSTAFVLLGFAFWQSLDEAVTIAQRGSLALGGVIVLIAALFAGYRRLRSRTNRRTGRSQPGQRATEAEAPSARPA
jgi:membrane protein DedA with SNARE-associated domain